MNVSKSIPDCTEPWTDTFSNYWPLGLHHFAEIFGVSSSIQTGDPLLWRGLLTPIARAAALQETRGHSLNCHEDSHLLRQYRQPFMNARGCLNPDLELLGNDGEAYRRWQARKNRQRREDKSSRTNKYPTRIFCRRRGNSRGQHQSQGQALSLIHI